MKINLKKNIAGEKKVLAMIPARSGSKRIKDKNITEIKGHPLIAYSIASARQSKVFEDIICATDNELYAKIANQYGASVPKLRPKEISGDQSPDFEWVKFMLSVMLDLGKHYDAFAILRPTSPFRSAKGIQSAWLTLSQDTGADSIRAVELCSQHPGKMWSISGKRMAPILPYKNDETPWHSCQYPSLPKIYIQNASLEIAWTDVVERTFSISGHQIIPFVTEEYEGFDINYPEDISVALELISSGKAFLPKV